MIWWLVDNATFWYVLLGLVLVAVAAAWWMQRTRPWLIALLVTLGLLLLLWLLTLFIVTDRLRLRLATEEMAAGVSKNQPERVAKHLAREFQFGTVNKKNATQKIAAAIKMYQIQDIYVTQHDFEKLDRPSRTARVTFLTRVNLGGSVELFRVRAEFVLEDEQWLLRSFTIHNPVVNHDTPIQVPLP